MMDPSEFIGMGIMSPITSVSKSMRIMATFFGPNDIVIFVAFGAVC